MSKSQETYSKKERNKKKAQKRKEKMEKRQARNDEKVKGTLDNMMAYIDADGNISDTPPDPDAVKVETALEDIVLGAAKRVEEDHSGTKTGTITFYNDEKGFGFIKITDSDDSVFVHYKSFVDESIGEGSKVTFETEKGEKGPVAINVILTKNAPKPESKVEEPIAEDAAAEDAEESTSEETASEEAEDSKEESEE